MKKFIILPLIATAALGLAACKPSTPEASNTADVSLNADLPVEDANSVAIDNSSVIENSVDANVADTAAPANAN